MIETVLLIAHTIAKIAIIIGKIILASILIEIAINVLAVLINLAIIAVIVIYVLFAVKTAITKYVLPFFHAVLGAIVSHPLTVSLMFAFIFGIAFIAEKDFRNFILRQNYPLIFAICTTAILALNLLILGKVVSSLFVIGVSLTITSTIYKILPTVLNSELNLLVKANIISRFSPLWMDSEILTVAKKPSTHKYLLNRKCTLEQLTKLLSIMQHNSTTNYSGDVFSKEEAAHCKNLPDDSALETLLTKPHIQKLLDSNRLKFSHIIDYWPLTFLEDERICQLVQLGELSIRECCYSVSNNKDFLQNIQLPIFANGLLKNSIDDISNIPPQTKRALALSTIRSLVQSEQLSLSKLNSLSWAQIDIINSGLWSWHFQISELCKLTSHQCTILSMDNAQYVLPRLFTRCSDLLKLEDSLQKRVLKILEMKISTANLSTIYKLSEDHWSILTRYEKQFISPDGIVDIRKLFQLDTNQLEMLLFPGTQEIVAANILSFTEASSLSLTKTSTDVLAAYKQTVVYSKDIDPQMILSLNESKLLQLLLPATIKLVYEGRVSLLQMISLSEAEVDTILINNQVLSMYSLDDNTKKSINLLTFQDSDFAKKLLKGQTTHDVKIHMSASKSALKLLRRYGDKYIEANLNAFINLILRTSHPYKKYAVKCIRRLKKPSNNYVDAVSNISITQLLSLTYMAICDHNTRSSSLENCLISMINALDDAERGDNAGARTEIFGREHYWSICVSGTFNKIIEGLCKMHPDATQKSASLTTASTRLPMIVSKEVAKYLEDRSKILDPRQWNTLLDKLHNEGVEAIYQNIRDKVSDVFSQEFGELFIGKQKMLADYIDSGIDTDITIILATFRHNEHLNEENYTRSADALTL